MRDEDPLEAVEHYLAAGDADTAYEVILETWLTPLQEGRSRGLSQACNALPEHLAGRAAILLILACCAWIADDPSRARLLAMRAGRADDAEASTPLERAASAIASVLITDDPEALRAALRRVHEIAAVPGMLPGCTLAFVLYIAGYTELRLRRDPERAIRTLRSALAECETQHLTSMAGRVAGTLSFTYAFMGRFAEALETIERAQTSYPADDEWQVYDGGAVAVTQGFIAYWRGDLDRVRTLLAPLFTTGRAAKAYGPVALFYDAVAAAASGDRVWQADALARLHEMPGETILGTPWMAFRACALSELAAAHGRVDDALRLADVAIAIPEEAPVPDAMAAEAYRRAGDLVKARQAVAHLAGKRLTPPARCILLLTDALLRDEAGRADAHVALEKALDIAAPEGIVQPFLAPLPEIGTLLANHARWGSRHDAFIAGCLARRASAEAAAHTHTALSSREREILAFLRTPLTLSEIAAELYVSSNTIKTHVRSIYRKLGVQNRREAVRTRL